MLICPECGYQGYEDEFGVLFVVFAICPACRTVFEVDDEPF